MSVRLTSEEAWAVVESAHTGIFTSLRADGVPVALPVWFVVLDGCVYVRSPAGAKKVARVRRDPRASFLVESGLRWAELEAVHLIGTAEVLSDEGEVAERVQKEFSAKYDPFRTPPKAMADATRAHYEVAKVNIRFVPDERIVSWDNRKLGLS
jgi:nitroimidazol reductase NimA-like FMN-containing flavoprotein (pyridoxamine 5'-phosphate oxidase superfamily)